MIGMAYAARHPERIARLVVLNTAAFHLPAAKSFPWPLWLCRNTPLGAWLVRGLNAFCRGTAVDRLHQAADAARRPRGLRRPLRLVGEPDRRPSGSSRTSRSARATGPTTSSRGSRSGSTRSPSVPMLIGWGMKDFVFDGHFLDEWIRRFPRGRGPPLRARPGTTSSRTSRTAWSRRSGGLSRPAPSRSICPGIVES